jgi:glutathione S-transferase
VVPTLIHDGKTIRESSVICEYADEVFPDCPLRPDNAFGRAQMRVWTKAVDEVYHPATRVVTFAATHRYTMLDKPADERERLLEEIPDPARRETKRQSIEFGFDFPEAAAGLLVYQKMIRDMEHALARTEWLAGDTYSLADSALTIYVNRLSVLSMSGMWEAVARKSPTGGNGSGHDRASSPP